MLEKLAAKHALNLGVVNFDLDGLCVLVVVDPLMVSYRDNVTTYKRIKNV